MQPSQISLLNGARGTRHVVRVGDDDVFRARDVRIVKIAFAQRSQTAGTRYSSRLPLETYIPQPNGRIRALAEQRHDREQQKLSLRRHDAD